jgi:hypothetical protein
MLALRRRAKEGHAMSPPSETHESREIEKVSFGAYAAMNLVFWAICAAQWLAAKLWLGPVEGISFFFFALAAGFTGVCVFDAVCDLCAQSGEAPRSSSLPSDDERQSSLSAKT